MLVAGLNRWILSERFRDLAKKACMVATCKDLRDAVALCLQRSECVLVERHTPKECLENPELNRTLPQACYVHFLRYLDCKRGQADRSKRIIGNGPKSVGKFEHDLELMRKGDFDPKYEMDKLAGGADHVTSRQEASKALQPPPKKKGWFSWWS